ncbi:Serine protease htra2, mitochondrial [Bulinus truncatus]|nr:Serine protease htra2, mitochondrial [Bulinus truncatus]
MSFKSRPSCSIFEIKGRHPFTGRPLQDGRVMEGQVTAVDPISDLATVKIPANNLPIIPLGSSSTIRPGEWVIAMGSPLSLSNTVTCGIVSSVQRASRELGLRNKDMDYIQTDAVINFGNSGGPLVNLDGQAIGINTMKVTTGISFAIPSDYAIKFLMKAEELMKNGQRENGFLKRRYMGITMLTLTENVMRDLKNNIKMPNFPDVDGGVFVYKVIPGSPAHMGGILAGDIIIDISGTPIKSAADVYDAVEKSDFLKVTLIRGSEKKVIPIDTKQTI